jgi:hypothetical protein
METAINNYCPEEIEGTIGEGSNDIERRVQAAAKRDGADASRVEPEAWKKTSVAQSKDKRGEEHEV